MSARRANPRFLLAGLDALMPMHVWIDSAGCMLRCGPSLAKLLPGRKLKGARFLEIAEVIRPRGIGKVGDIFASGGPVRLRLRLRDAARTPLRGIAVPLAGGKGGFVNLAPGISVVDLVTRFGLTSSDFAPTDPTVEMLYLIEAQGAIMTESRKLTERLQDAKSEAERQALTDTLTGLWNRRAMGDLLGRLVGARVPEAFGIMHIDLDYFKSVNDTLGHAAGDHVLREVARVLRAETRNGDLVARVGGDEFVIVFRDCADLALLAGIGRRIIDKLEVPIPFGAETCNISASIGTTVSTFYDRLEADRILDDADLATYASKAAGRAQHKVFDPAMRALPGPPSH